ncbi:hypothetical protein LSH36_1170g00007 [Paralvinella palmiformis]|uniref:G-protein coupled receptors family 1 profile domain-containing protein n=1 Tax=Paralvinella palmiformis TaxID=53620 RepID=A0AAD9IVY0_9ANNE|nr:hypothetical protein LSH36_1170g00007 [Paralvinella palmiformis]
MMADSMITLAGNVVNASVSIRHQDPDSNIDRFRFAVNVVVMGFFSVLGLICNSLAIVTLQTDRHKMSITVLLQGLAFSDNLFLLYTLLYSTLRTTILTNDVTEWRRHLSDQIVAYVLPFGWIAQTASIWIICLVTVDRYLAICHPFTSEKHCSLARSKRLLVAIWLAAAFFNVPRFFYYHHLAFDGREDTDDGIFVAHSDATTDEAWRRYHAIYHIGLTIACHYVVPLPVVVVLNVLLVREIACARARRRLLQLGKRRAKDNIRITLNLVVVVSVFIVCEVPDLVASVLRISSINASMDPVAMCYYMSMKELLLVMCATTNFLIYCAFYAKFRNLLSRMLCKKTKRAPDYDSDFNSSMKTAHSVEYLNLKVIRQPEGGNKKDNVMAMGQSEGGKTVFAEDRT